MDDRYLDVLDALGKTPREFGALHVHVEPLVQDETLRGLLTVWVQAAFEPNEGGTLHVSAEGENGAPAIVESQTRWPVPPLKNGKVIKWQLPFSLQCPALSVTVSCQAPLTAKAVRVRQPWKLFTTVRAPTIDEMSWGEKALAVGPREEPIAGFFAEFGRILKRGLGGKTPSDEAPSAPWVVPAVSGIPAPLAEASVETVWELGQPAPNGAVARGS